MHTHMHIGNKTINRCAHALRVWVSFNRPHSYFLLLAFCWLKVKLKLFIFSKNPKTNICTWFMCKNALFLIFFSSLLFEHDEKIAWLFCSRATNLFFRSSDGYQARRKFMTGKTVFRRRCRLLQSFDAFYAFTSSCVFIYEGRTKTVARVFTGPEEKWPLNFLKMLYLSFDEWKTNDFLSLGLSVCLSNFSLNLRLKPP